MNNQPQARKTRYRGISFPSKGEARFARFLDELNLGWFHDPPFLLCGDGYKPDFAIINFMRLNPPDPIKEGSPNVWATLKIVEYKPARPSPEYIAEFCHRASEMYRRASEAKRSDLFNITGDLEFAICVGGMGFDESETMVMNWDEGETYLLPGTWEPGWWFTEENPDAINYELRTHRFDLEK